MGKCAFRRKINRENDKFCSKCEILEVQNKYRCSEACPLYVEEEEYASPTIDMNQCFGLNAKGKCRVLVRDVVCDPETCVFFKTRKEVFYD